MFAGDAINFSALPYTPHEMEGALHEFELPNVHYTVVRAALGQMGVAGDDSWGARVHPEYRLDAQNRMEFAFVFKGSDGLRFGGRVCEFCEFRYLPEASSYGKLFIEQFKNRRCQEEL